MDAARKSRRPPKTRQVSPAEPPKGPRGRVSKQQSKVKKEDELKEKPAENKTAKANKRQKLLQVAVVPRPKKTAKMAVNQKKTKPKKGAKAAVEAPEAPSSPACRDEKLMVLRPVVVLRRYVGPFCLRLHPSNQVTPAASPQKDATTTAAPMEVEASEREDPDLPFEVDPSLLEEGNPVAPELEDLDSSSDCEFESPAFSPHTPTMRETIEALAKKVDTTTWEVPKTPDPIPFSPLDTPESCRLTGTPSTSTETTPKSIKISEFESKSPQTLENNKESPNINNASKATDKEFNVTTPHKINQNIFEFTENHSKKMSPHNSELNKEVPSKELVVIEPEKTSSTDENQIEAIGMEDKNSDLTSCKTPSCAVETSVLNRTPTPTPMEVTEENNTLHTSELIKNSLDTDSTSIMDSEVVDLNSVLKSSIEVTELNLDSDNINVTKNSKELNPPSVKISEINHLSKNHESVVVESQDKNAELIKVSLLNDKTNTESEIANEELNLPPSPTLDLGTDAKCTDFILKSQDAMETIAEDLISPSLEIQGNSTLPVNENPKSQASTSNSDVNHEEISHLKTEIHEQYESEAKCISAEDETVPSESEPLSPCDNNLVNTEVLDPIKEVITKDVTSMPVVSPQSSVSCNDNSIRDKIFTKSPVISSEVLPLKITPDFYTEVSIKDKASPTSTANAVKVSQDPPREEVLEECVKESSIEDGSFLHAAKSTDSASVKEKPDLLDISPVERLCTSSNESFHLKLENSSVKEDHGMVVTDTPHSPGDPCEGTVGQLACEGVPQEVSDLSPPPQLCDQVCTVLPPVNTQLTADSKSLEQELPQNDATSCASAAEITEEVPCPSMQQSGNELIMTELEQSIQIQSEIPTSVSHENSEATAPVISSTQDISSKPKVIFKKLRLVKTNSRSCNISDNNKTVTPRQKKSPIINVAKVCSNNIKQTETKPSSSFSPSVLCPDSSIPSSEVIVKPVTLLDHSYCTVKELSNEVAPPKSELAGEINRHLLDTIVDCVMLKLTETDPKMTDLNCERGNSSLCNGDRVQTDTIGSPVKRSFQNVKTKINNSNHETSMRDNILDKTNVPKLSKNSLAHSPSEKIELKSSSQHHDTASMRIVNAKGSKIPSVIHEKKASHDHSSSEVQSNSNSHKPSTFTLRKDQSNCKRRLESPDKNRHNSEKIVNSPNIKMRKVEHPSPSKLKGEKEAKDNENSDASKLQEMTKKYRDLELRFQNGLKTLKINVSEVEKQHKIELEKIKSENAEEKHKTNLFHTEQQSKLNSKIKSLESKLKYEKKSRSRSKSTVKKVEKELKNLTLKYKKLQSDHLNCESTIKLYQSKCLNAEKSVITLQHQLSRSGNDGGEGSSQASKQQLMEASQKHAEIGPDEESPPSVNLLSLDQKDAGEEKPPHQENELDMAWEWAEAKADKSEEVGSSRAPLEATPPKRSKRHPNVPLEKKALRGILISPGFRDSPLGRKARKSVRYADGVNPGEQSPSNMSEHSHRKLPQEERFSKTKLPSIVERQARKAKEREEKKEEKKKAKAKLLKAAKEEEGKDKKGVPPPPPGMPPPHLLKYYLHFQAAAAAGYFYNKDKGTYTLLVLRTKPRKPPLLPLPSQPSLRTVPPASKPPPLLPLLPPPPSKPPPLLLQPPLPPIPPPPLLQPPLPSVPPPSNPPPPLPLLPRPLSLLPPPPPPPAVYGATNTSPATSGHSNAVGNIMKAAQSVVMRNSRKSSYPPPLLPQLKKYQKSERKRKKTRFSPY